MCITVILHNLDARMYPPATIQVINCQSACAYTLPVRGFASGQIAVSLIPLPLSDEPLRLTEIAARYECRYNITRRVGLVL